MTEKNRENKGLCLGEKTNAWLVRVAEVTMLKKGLLLQNLNS